eukprot:1733891-Pleurochrysis_carterae.AAC.1
MVLSPSPTRSSASISSDTACVPCSSSTISHKVGNSDASCALASSAARKCASMSTSALPPTTCFTSPFFTVCLRPSPSRTSQRVPVWVVTTPSTRAAEKTTRHPGTISKGDEVTAARRLD